MHLRTLFAILENHHERDAATKHSFGISLWTCMQAACLWCARRYRADCGLE